MSTPPETLVDDGLTLTRVHPTFCDALCDAVRTSVPELGVWFGWANDTYDRHAAATFVAEQWLAWEAGTSFQFALTVRGEPGIVGMCGIDEISPVRKSGNLGYWIRSDVAGRGLTTRAARLVARFGFAQLALRRIHLFHGVGNHGSRRVAEKVGFVLEGRLRQHLELNGEGLDCLTYGLVDPGEITG